jgi:hypothetical protein
LITDEDRQVDNADGRIDRDIYSADALAPALSQLNLGGQSNSTVHDAGHPTPRQSSATYHRIPRRSLDKPLPSIPSADISNIGDRTHTRKSASAEDLERQLGVTNVVDLGHTEDTTIYERMNPAVVYEEVISNVHEIRHERLTSEHHNHDIYHRILPIKDIEVKPARHYIKDNAGNLREVPERQVTGRSPKLTHRVLEEVYKDMLPKETKSSGPRRFTARDFPDSEGDYREVENPDGSLKTEQWWVHPPTLDEGGRKSGQTYPFHLNSTDPRDDGFRV